MKRFTQAQHVRLGGGIDGEALHTLVGQHAGNEQNLSASASPHVLGKNVSDGSQARDIELHQLNKTIATVQVQP